MRYKMTFDELMMAYEYAGQLHGFFKPKRRKTGIDKDAIKAEIDAIHRRVGK